MKWARRDFSLRPADHRRSSERKQAFWIPDPVQRLSSGSNGSEQTCSGTFHNTFARRQTQSGRFGKEGGRKHRKNRSWLHQMHLHSVSLAYSISVFHRRMSRRISTLGKKDTWSCPAFTDGFRLGVIPLRHVSSPNAPYATTPPSYSLGGVASKDGRTCP